MNTHQDNRPTCVEQLFNNRKKTKIRGKCLCVNTKKLIIVGKNSSADCMEDVGRRYRLSMPNCDDTSRLVKKTRSPVCCRVCEDENFKTCDKIYENSNMYCVDSYCHCHDHDDFKCFDKSSCLIYCKDCVQPDKDIQLNEDVRPSKANWQSNKPMEVVCDKINEYVRPTKTIWHSNKPTEVVYDKIDPYENFSTELPTKEAPHSSIGSCERFISSLCENYILNDDGTYDSSQLDSKRRRLNNQIFISGQKVKKKECKSNADALRRMCFSSCMRALLKPDTVPPEKKTRESQTDDLFEDCDNKNWSDNNTSNTNKPNELKHSNVTNGGAVINPDNDVMLNRLSAGKTISPEQLPGNRYKASVESQTDKVLICRSRNSDEVGDFNKEIIVLNCSSVSENISLEIPLQTRYKVDANTQMDKIFSNNGNSGTVISNNEIGMRNRSSEDKPIHSEAITNFKTSVKSQTDNENSSTVVANSEVASSNHSPTVSETPLKGTNIKVDAETQVNSREDIDIVISNSEGSSSRASADRSVNPKPPLNGTDLVDVESQTDDKNSATVIVNEVTSPNRSFTDKFINTETPLNSKIVKSIESQTDKSFLLNGIDSMVTSSEKVASLNHSPAKHINPQTLQKGVVFKVTVELQTDKGFPFYNEISGEFFSKNDMTLKRSSADKTINPEMSSKKIDFKGSVESQPDKVFPVSVESQTDDVLPFNNKNHARVDAETSWNVSVESQTDSIHSKNNDNTNRWCYCVGNRPEQNPGAYNSVDPNTPPKIPDTIAKINVGSQTSTVACCGCHCTKKSIDIPTDVLSVSIGSHSYNPFLYDLSEPCKSLMEIKTSNSKEESVVDRYHHKSALSKRKYDATSQKNFDNIDIMACSKCNNCKNLKSSPTGNMSWNCSRDNTNRNSRGGMSCTRPLGSDMYHIKESYFSLNKCLDNDSVTQQESGSTDSLKQLESENVDDFNTLEYIQCRKDLKKMFNLM